MAFFNSAVTVLQTLVIALGAGLGIWGAINLLEGYGNDNPGAKSQGIYSSIASLSHISQVPGHEAAHGWRRCCPHRHHPCTSALRTVRLITKQGGNRLWTAYSNRSQTG